VGRLQIDYRYDEATLEVVAMGPRAAIYEDLARRRMGWPIDRSARIGNDSEDPAAI
jgi:hypothetical protein